MLHLDSSRLLRRVIAAPNAVRTAHRSRPSSSRCVRCVTSTTPRSRPTARGPRGPRSSPTRRATRSLGAISVADLASGKTRRLTAAQDGKAHREMGRRLLARRQDDRLPVGCRRATRQLQIWLAPAAGGPPRQLTRVRGQLDHLRWSPDGRSIAFLFVEGSTQETGALVAYKPDSGVVAGDDRGAAHRRRRGRDGQGPAGLPRRPLRLRLRLVARRADVRGRGRRRAPGTNNYWVAELYRSRPASGRRARSGSPRSRSRARASRPTESPIAVIHGIMSDEGSTGGDVWVRLGRRRHRAQPDAGHEVVGERALLALDRRDPLHRARRRRTRRLAAVDPGDRASSSRVWTGRRVARGLLASRARQPRRPCDPQLLPEAARGLCRPDGPVEAAHVRQREGGGPGGARPARSTGRATARRSRAGCSIRATSIPRSATRWSSSSTAARRRRKPSAGPRAGRRRSPPQGYFVFLPNPRGSYGFGEAFAQGNVKDFGGGDLRDILSGRRRGRWRRARRRASALGITRLELRRLHGDVGRDADQPLRRRRGRAPASRAGRATTARTRSTPGCSRSSAPPSTTTRRSTRSPRRSSSSRTSKTPTLVLHGDRDSEVPTPQGYEFWHALKALGVPTQLVIYTDEGHGIRKPEHQLDILAAHASAGSTSTWPEVGPPLRADRGRKHR